VTGPQPAEQAAPQPGAASPRPDSLAAALERSLVLPCRCWSCDRQCGGDTSAGSCGPLADLDGRPVCEFCRKAADVIDTQHTGAKVTLDQQCVRLNPDTFGSHRYGGSLWFDARSARHLGLVLIARAAELDLAEAAAVADDDRGAGEVLCGDRNRCARPYRHEGADHRSFDGDTWSVIPRRAADQ
jgi:hypothetical protein